MKKRFFISVFLLLAVFMQTVIISPIAATEENGIYEISEFRKEYEKHFAMPDGTVVATTYREPVNYYDTATQAWKEIDNTLSLVAGRYRTGDNDGFSVSFKGAADTGDLAEITDGGYTLSWNIVMQSFNNTESKISHNATAEIVSFTDTADEFTAEKSASALTYTAPFSGKLINVDFKVSHHKVKEEITVYAPVDARAVVYEFTCTDLTATLNSDNTVTFADENGVTRFTVLAPYMYDSAGASSDDFTLELIQRGNKCYVATVPDSDWINAEERVYPVVIDPTVESAQSTTNVIDTYIHEGDAARDHINETTMTVGLYGGVQNYSIVKIVTWPTVPTNATVLNSSLVFSMPIGSITGGPFTLKYIREAWMERTLSYATKPDARNEQYNITANFPQLSLTFDITSHYNAVKAGTRTDYGFMVHYTDVTVVDFNSLYTSNYSNSSKHPLMKVTYTLTSEVESNNNIATANEMEIYPVPETISSISGVSNSDYDYFVFAAPRHGRIKVTLSVTGASASHTVTVYDNNGISKVSKTTGGLHPDENASITSVSFVALKDGDQNGTLENYYISVRNIGNSGKSYRLTIQYVTDYAELDWVYPLQLSDGGITNKATSPVSGRNLGDWEYHQGLDISAFVGTNVYAVTDATVVASGNYGNMGNFIVLQTNISGGDTDFATGLSFVIVYMHLNQRRVSANQTVSKGQLIGTSGNTGGVDPHLHFEVYVCTQVNPESVVAQTFESIINPYEIYYNTVDFRLSRKHRKI